MIRYLYRAAVIAAAYTICLPVTLACVGMGDEAWYTFARDFWRGGV